MRAARISCFVAIAFIVAASTILRAAESLRVTPIVRDDQVLVTIELAEVYTDAVRDAIASGLTTTVTYELELATATARTRSPGSLFGWAKSITAQTKFTFVP